MMARSKCSNQRPDTLMQDRSLPARRNHLQRTAGPYIWVKLRRTQYEHMFSALLSNSDIARRSRHVSNVPHERTFGKPSEYCCEETSGWSFGSPPHVIFKAEQPRAARTAHGVGLPCEYCS